MTGVRTNRPADSVDGETMFAEWLDQCCIRYERNYVVTSGNVDFLIKFSTSHVYCDVKEVRASPGMPDSTIDADGHIRSDIRKLRAKFDFRPTLPVLLATINFCPKFFTGLTVARAMLGEIGVLFDRHTRNVRNAMRASLRPCW